MTNFIKQDTEELKRHMASCKIKYPIVYIMNSYFIGTLRFLPNHAGAFALFFVLIITFLQ